MKRRQLFFILIIYKDSSHDVFFDYGFDGNLVLKSFLETYSPEDLSYIDKVFVDLVKFL